jgi:hypothetical protein
MNARFVGGEKQGLVMTFCKESVNIGRGLHCEGEGGSRRLEGMDSANRL